MNQPLFQASKKKLKRENHEKKSTEIRSADQYACGLGLGAFRGRLAEGRKNGGGLARVGRWSGAPVLLVGFSKAVFFQRHAMKDHRKSRKAKILCDERAFLDKKMAKKPQKRLPKKLLRSKNVLEPRKIQRRHFFERRCCKSRAARPRLRLRWGEAKGKTSENSRKRSVFSMFFLGNPRKHFFWSLQTSPKLPFFLLLIKLTKGVRGVFMFSSSLLAFSTCPHLGFKNKRSCASSCVFVYIWMKKQLVFLSKLSLY